MQQIRRIFLFPIAIVLIIVVTPIFIDINLPLQILNEIRATITELKEPSDAAYNTFENNEWGIRFEYPSHLELAGGETDNGQQYALILYEQDQNAQVIDLNQGKTEVFGVVLTKNRTFDQELDRVGGNRIDLVDDTQLQGYEAKRIKAHVDVVTGATEEALVVNNKKYRTTFYLSYKSNKNLKSYFNLMIDTFVFEN